MRLRELLTPEKRSAPRHCERPNCMQPTREGKAFCSDHVEDHGYVQSLLVQLAERDRQDEDVFKRGAKAVALEAITAQEILRHLHFHGPRTKERLVRELNLEPRVLTGYVNAFVRERLVTLGKTKRGSTLVKLRPGAAT